MRVAGKEGKPICLDEAELEKLRSSASMLRDIAGKLDL